MLPKRMPNFAKGIYLKKIDTENGEIINIEIDINNIRHNWIKENQYGRECVFATIKTSQDGKLYSVLNESAYDQK